MGFTGKLAGFHPKYGYKMVKNLVGMFGFPFIGLNTSVFFSCVGIIYYLITTIQLPYYKSAGVDAQTQSEMAAIAKSPWSCKGFLGTVADLVPLFGRQKFYYMTFFLFFGMILFLCIPLIPYSTVKREPLIAGTAFFVLNLCSAACDLLVEAKYIELMQRNPTVKSDFITFAWFCETSGQLLPSTFVGIIADNMDVRISFYIFFPLLLFPIPFVLFGGVIEDKVPKEKSGKIDKERLASQWQLVILTLLQATLALGLLIITFFGNSAVQLVYIVITAIFLLGLNFLLLDKITALYILHIFVNHGHYLNIQGALEYYYTAKEPCVIDGPQFTFTITSSLGPLFFTIAQFLAILSFQIIFTDWNFRSVYLLTTFMKIIGSLSDISMVHGWNRIIGIPDELLYIFGYSTFSQVVYILAVLCNSYMISKLCPRTFEATMFAYIAGISHFATTASYYFGVFFMDILKIQSIIEDGKPCNYENLTLLIIISHILLPLLSIPLIYLTVPNIRLDEIMRDPINDKIVYSIKKVKKCAKVEL